MGSNNDNDIFSAVLGGKNDAGSDTSSVSSTNSSPSLGRRKSSLFGFGGSENVEEKAARKANKALLKQQEANSKEAFKQKEKELKDEKKRAEADMKERKKTLSNSGSSYIFPSFMDEGKGMSLGSRAVATTSSGLFMSAVSGALSGQLTEWNSVENSSWTVAADGTLTCGTVGTYLLEGFANNCLSTGPLSLVYTVNGVVIPSTSVFTLPVVYNSLYNGFRSTTRKAFSPGDTLTVSLSNDVSFLDNSGNPNFAMSLTLQD